MNIELHTKNFFHQYAQQNFTFIIAVSGGKDSMALLHLCKKHNLNMIVAHCNFMLRGNQSMDEEQFVRSYCNSHNIKFESVQFNTKDIVRKQKLSVQETARQLRYNWFNTLLDKYNAQFILTAHHANDLAETFIFNAARGTGIKGLAGIPYINKNIIRPLLYCSQTDIEQYIETNNIPFKTDSSNLLTTYKRNYIRHKIVPRLLEVNNNAVKHIADTTQHLRQALLIIDDKLSELKTKHTYTLNQKFIINVGATMHLPYYKYFIYHCLNSYAFNQQQLSEVCEPNVKSGSTWLTKHHQLLVDREKIVVTPIDYPKPETLVFEHSLPDTFNYGEYNFVWQIVLAKEVTFEDNNLYFDADYIKFPVTIRAWKKGDKFIPLGMKNFKKLSDFFSDLKITNTDKLQLPIICFDNIIAAVAPYRIANQFKVTNQTTNVLILTVIKHNNQ